MAYATLNEYEVITGSKVPEDESARVTRALQTGSDLFALYLGDREAEIAAAYPSLLADLVVARVYRLRAMPIGIRSESVGGSSVTYDSVGSSPFGLTGDEVRLLSMMLTGGRATALRSVVMSSQGITTTTALEEEV